MLVDSEFASLFRTDERNDTTEASVVVDMSRLSDVHNSDEETRDKQDDSIGKMGEGYRISEEDEKSTERLPFLLNKQE